MQERDVIKSIIDFSFIMKAQLKSEETSLLRSIFAILIMEAEDVMEMIEEKSRQPLETRQRRTTG